MPDQIEPEDVFSKDSLLVHKNLNFLTRLTEALNDSGIELAALGITIGLITSGGEHFFTACVCLTILGISKTITSVFTQYAKTYRQKKQSPLES